MILLPSIMNNQLFLIVALSMNRSEVLPSQSIVKSNHVKILRSIGSLPFIIKGDEYHVLTLANEIQLKCLSGYNQTMITILEDMLQGGDINEEKFFESLAKCGIDPPLLCLYWQSAPPTTSRASRLFRLLISQDQNDSLGCFST